MSLRSRNRTLFGWAMTAAFPFLSVLNCSEVPRNSSVKNDLSKLETVSLEIVGRTTYTAYVAREDVENGRIVQLGLMNTTEAELPEDRGMIFVFNYDDLRSFWMRNTIIPLDIAYIRSDGTIVKTYTMQALNEIGYPSIEPARYALEVRAGQFAKWGITVGDRVTLPASISGD
ncbi:MAG: DUF192 domain-containing protein [Phycisphaerae bacterium]|nr:DUF192 domain-containing protein [Phycisphaerae bacterium]